jgi:hypothetical protein
MQLPPFTSDQLKKYPGGAGRKFIAIIQRDANVGAWRAVDYPEMSGQNTFASINSSPRRNCARLKMGQT